MITVNIFFVKDATKCIIIYIFFRNIYKQNSSIYTPKLAKLYQLYKSVQLVFFIIQEDLLKINRTMLN